MTLRELKKALKIDFRDDDDFLQILLSAAIERAKEVTGLDELNDDMRSGIIQDVSTRYMNRDDVGESTAGVNASIYVYRRNSVRPMF